MEVPGTAPAICSASHTPIQIQKLGELRVCEGPAGKPFLCQGAGQLVQQILPESDPIGQRAEGKAIPSPIEKPPLRPVGADQIDLLAAALPGAGDLLCDRLLISPSVKPILNGYQRLILSVEHAVHGYTEARRRAEAIAEKLVGNAVAVDEAYEQYSDLRAYLRSTTLSLSEEDSRDIPDYGDWRKHQMGRMVIRKGHTNIDQVYQEMSELWPEFFDEQRESNPVDQLLHIAEVMDGIYNVEEYNPFGPYMQQAITGAANEIMEQFFDLPQTRATFADRQARKLDDAKAKGRERVQKVQEQNAARLTELRRQNRERTAKAVERERTRRAEQIGKLKQRYREKDAAGRERRSHAGGTGPKSGEAEICCHESQKTGWLVVDGEVCSFCTDISLPDIHEKTGLCIRHKPGFSTASILYYIIRFLWKKKSCAVRADPDFSALWEAECLSRVKTGDKGAGGCYNRVIPRKEVSMQDGKRVEASDPGGGMSAAGLPIGVFCYGDPGRRAE